MPEYPVTARRQTDVLNAVLLAPDQLSVIEVASIIGVHKGTASRLVTSLRGDHMIDYGQSRLNDQGNRQKLYRTTEHFWATFDRTIAEVALLPEEEQQLFDEVTAARKELVAQPEAEDASLLVAKARYIGGIAALGEHRDLPQWFPGTPGWSILATAVVTEEQGRASALAEIIPPPPRPRTQQPRQRRSTFSASSIMPEQKQRLKLPDDFSDQLHGVITGYFGRAIDDMPLDDASILEDYEIEAIDLWGIAEELEKKLGIVVDWDLLLDATTFGELKQLIATYRE